MLQAAEARVTGIRIRVLGVGGHCWWLVDGICAYKQYCVFIWSITAKKGAHALQVVIRPPASMTASLTLGRVTRTR